MLGLLSNKIGLSKYAIMSKQVKNANGRNNIITMEDIFEAFIGAILIDYKDQDNDANSISGKGYYIAEKGILLKAYTPKAGDGGWLTRQHVGHVAKYT